MGGKGKLEASRKKAVESCCSAHPWFDPDFDFDSVNISFQFFTWAVRCDGSVVRYQVLCCIVTSPVTSEGSVKPQDTPRGHTPPLVLGHTSLVGTAVTWAGGFASSGLSFLTTRQSPNLLVPLNCSWPQAPQVNSALS